jgi:hypothetical protein
MCHEEKPKVIVGLSCAMATYQMSVFAFTRFEPNAA